MARQFARSMRTYNAAAIVQQETAEHLIGMIHRAVGPAQPRNVLELGCGTGLLTAFLVREFPIQHLVLNDLLQNVTTLARRRARGRSAIRVELRLGDMECIELPMNQDLVASNAVLQWAGDPIAMLHRMQSAVKPNGLLALATFGPENLRETRALTGCSLHYPPLRTIQRELALESEVLESHEQHRTVYFESAFAVLQHLKRTGVNSLASERWSPRAVKAFCNLYEFHFRREEQVPLTYHPMLIIARRRGTAASARVEGSR
ncbi:MAG: malonyl-ACP O-methyltransferase BioC [Planctomycetota bacterium]